MSRDRARFEAVAAAVADPVHRYALRRTDAETAKEVLAGRTMAEIPLMSRVAEVTVDAVPPAVFETPD